MADNKHILIARTDSIGDVMLTLPLAGYLKTNFAGCTITFAGRTYTKDVIACSAYVDQFLNWDELSGQVESDAISHLKSLNLDEVIFALPNKTLARWCKKAGVKTRIGVSRRWFHWVYCNVRPSFSRRNSDLHEAQLNLKLLGLEDSQLPNLSELASLSGFQAPELENEKLNSLFDSAKKSVILHPKSQGSAVEWGLENFSNLAIELSNSGFRVFVTGTAKEGELIRPEFTFNEDIIDVTGAMTLRELIAFIAKSDALVAASTGPLHIAAACGVLAVGLYSPKRPIHPGRWAPIGNNIRVIESDSEDAPLDEIEVFKVLELIKDDLRN